MATSKSLFGTNEKGIYFLDDVNCSGNESNILECPHPPRTNCRHRLEEAGVICGVNSTGNKQCVFMIIMILTIWFMDLKVQVNDALQSTPTKLYQSQTAMLVTSQLEGNNK